MTGTRLLTIPLLCAGLGASMLLAGDFSSYRGIQFGMNLSTAAKQAGTRPAEARTVHQRPALIQEMEWHPRSPVLTDPHYQAIRARRQARGDNQNAATGFSAT